MSGTGKTDRTVAITDSLWETLEEMSTQMGVERDALVNQAIFALARFHGYATPGHVEAAAKKPEPPPEKVEMSPLLTSAKLATPGTASEFDEPEPEPEPEAEPTPAPAKVPKAATARSSRVAKPEPVPAPEPEAVPSKRASQRVRSINAEVDRQVRVPAKAAASSEFDDELDAAKAEADAEEQEQEQEQAEPEAPADSGETPAGEPEEQAAPEPEAEAEAEPDQEEAPAEPEEAPAPAEAAAPSGDDDDLPDDAKTQARSSKKDEEAEAEPEPEQEGEGEIYLQVEGGEPVLMATDRFLIGRGKHCDLVLLSNRVSREHAIVHRKNKEIILEDLNSSNGTWMDQKRIAKRTLNDGDTFTCGNVRVHCDFGGRSRA